MSCLLNHLPRKWWNNKRFIFDCNNPTSFLERIPADMSPKGMPAARNRIALNGSDETDIPETRPELASVPLFFPAEVFDPFAFIVSRFTDRTEKAHARNKKWSIILVGAKSFTLFIEMIRPAAWRLANGPICWRTTFWRRVGEAAATAVIDCLVPLLLPL